LNRIRLNRKLEHKRKHMNTGKGGPGKNPDLETYLRSFAPRVAEVELSAIVQQAGIPGENRTVRTRHPMRNWQAVAASWLCGVAVGSAAMFAVNGKSGETSNQQVTTENSIKPDAVTQENTLTESLKINATVAEGKPNSKPMMAAPDLIAFAQNAQRLRPQIYLKSIPQDWPDGMAITDNRQATANRQGITPSDIIQAIQIPESSYSTRQSLFQEILSTYPQIGMDRG
jgi:hypothetical protein